MTSNELEIFKQSILDDVRVIMQATGQVTQYIGARYVPLFADPLDWSDTREYEPLTIVLHQGNSYTSRQFVPRGIDISNSEFWANTGNYNAQIERYRQEVATFDGRITENANAIEAVNGALKTESGKITALQGIVNNAHRKFLWIGDSFSADAHASEWSPVKVLQRRGWDIDNQVYDGAGFVGVNAASHKTFIKQLQAPSDKSVYTDVVVYGGNNDQNIETSLVTAAIREFARYFNENYPNANLWFFTDNTPNAADEGKLYQYIYAMETTCRRARIFSNVNGVQLCVGGYQSSSNLHPSNSCGEYLADYFNKVLNYAQQDLAVIMNPDHKAVITDCILISNLSELYIPEFRITTGASQKVNNGDELFKFAFMIPSSYNFHLISQRSSVYDSRTSAVQFIRKIDPNGKLFILSAQYFGDSIPENTTYYFGACCLKWRGVR